MPCRAHDSNAILLLIVDQVVIVMPLVVELEHRRLQVGSFVFDELRVEVDLIGFRPGLITRSRLLAQLDLVLRAARIQQGQLWLLIKLLLNRLVLS